MTFYVNTDYESVLFHNRSSLRMVHELEFLALWLVNSLKNTVEYNEDYLARVQRHTGRRIELLPDAKKALNWWGELENLKLERELNSKETNQNILPGYPIIRSVEELKLLDQYQEYLFKSFDGVSGKGNKLLHQVKESDFPLIAEVLHKRIVDFSSYTFSTGERIYYQNFIGPQFSYKGSLIDLKNCRDLFELDFVKDHDSLSWQQYLDEVSVIEAFVRARGEGGFSIDSYIHQKGIRALCEINYRRTMGVTAFEIAKVVSRKRFQFFTIIKTGSVYQQMLKQCEAEDILLLSHEKTLFAYFLLSGVDRQEIQKKIKKLELISGTSLAVNI